MRSLGVFLFTAFLGLASSARALPEIGSEAPQVELTTADGDSSTFQAALGRPALVVYESSASRSQNWPFKKKLKELVETTTSYRRQVALFPIADVEGYDFWPVRGFAADAVRAEAKRIGSPIYCDWKGKLRDALDVQRGMSSIILLSRSGKVLFASEGPLVEDEQQHVLELLREQLRVARADVTPSDR